MKLELEFEEQEEGSWTARIPDFPELVGTGRTRHDAAIGLTVSGLRLLADRVASHAGETESDEPSEIIAHVAAHEAIAAMLRELIAQESGKIPVDLPESFRAGWADYKAGRVVDMDRALEDAPPSPV